MKFVMVTGGSGYIGRHLIKHLVSRDISVINVDRKEPKLAHGDEMWLPMDLTVAHSDKLPACEAVVHLAALKSVHDSFRHPGKYIYGNVDMLISALMMAKAARAGKFILASSAAVYPEGGPFSEKAFTSPSTPYGVSKELCEYLVCGKDALDHKMDLHVLRIFNVVGVRETSAPVDLSTLFGRVTECGLTKEKFTAHVMSNGFSPARDFIHVLDVVDVIHEAIFPAGGETVPHTINVGSGVPTKVSQVLAAACALYPDFRYEIMELDVAGAVGFSCSINARLRKLVKKSKEELNPDLLNALKEHKSRGIEQ